MQLLDWHVLIKGGVAALIAGVMTLALTPPVIKAARLFDWVAYPETNRWHRTPTASMGGIALYGAATLAVFLVLPLSEVGLLWGGATLLFVVGGIDDRYAVRPAAKLAAQVVAAGMLLGAGYAFGPQWPLWLSVPITLLWVLGITNAINLLDNMDGLAAGVVGIAAFALVGIAARGGSTTAVAFAGSVGGASLGFLVFNFKPARVFMGDCGSLFLGYLIAASALMGQQQVTDLGNGVVLLVPLFVLAVPILDTALVTFVRTRAGRSVAEGGRDHTSHRLVFNGLSEASAVLALYGVSLCSGGLALSVFFVDALVFYALAALLASGLAAFGVYLARANVYQTAAEKRNGTPAPQDERRVLVYGAGTAGAQLLRWLRRSPGQGRIPVGVIDDNPPAQGRTVQGLAVLGGGDDLVQVCREKEVEEVVMATDALSGARRRAVSRACREAGISCTSLDVSSTSSGPTRSNTPERADPFAS